MGMAAGIGVRAAPPGVRTFEVRGEFLGVSAGAPGELGRLEGQVALDLYLDPWRALGQYW